MRYLKSSKSSRLLLRIFLEKKIKILRSDNGGEFTSNEFKELCKEDRIKRDLITFFNTQHNGVVERKNISIMEAIKDTIHD